MGRLFSYIITATFGLWLAVLFIPGTHVTIYTDSHFFGIFLTKGWQVFLLLGAALGLLNCFIKPLLKLIAFPLRIITLGLFSIVVQMAIVWLLDVMFREFSAPWFWPLLWTSLIIWILSIFLGRSALGKNS